MLSWEDRAKTRWIKLSGELDHDGYEAFGEDFRRVAKEAPEGVVVDLTGVTFVASQGLRLLLQAQQELRKQGRGLHVHGLKPNVRRVFETTGLFTAIPEHKG